MDGPGAFLFNELFFWGGLAFPLQLICIAHLFINKRDGWWILGILLFPLLGVACYFVAEILPDIQAGRFSFTGRTSRGRPRARRRVRALKKKLEVADTNENRFNLAEALLDAGKHAEAEALLRSCLGGYNAGDPTTLFLLARALYEMERYGEAREALEASFERRSRDALPQRHLLLARTLEKLGEPDEAIDEYDAAISTGFSGDEARTRKAMLLTRMEKTTAAEELFRLIIKDFRISPRHYRAAQREWTRIAKQELAKLKRQAVANV